jgi:hypothetical protein
LKRGKPLTRTQKEIVAKNGLNWKDYQFVEEWETKIVIMNKQTGARKAINKQRGNYER